MIRCNTSNQEQRTSPLQKELDSKIGSALRRRGGASSIRNDSRRFSPTSSYDGYQDMRNTSSELAEIGLTKSKLNVSKKESYLRKTLKLIKV